MWIWAEKFCVTETFINTHTGQHNTLWVSAGHESACKERADSDTPLCTSFMGLTCVFGLHGLFGLMPHGLAVLLQLEVARLFPWARTDFQKVPAVYQELQVFVTLQTCGEDKDKTTPVVILSKLTLFPFERQICGSFPTSQHPFLYEGRTNKRIVLSLCGPIEEGTNPFMSPAAEEENVVLTSM